MWDTPVEFAKFAWATWWNSWSVVTTILFAVDQTLKWFVPSIKQMIDSTIPPNLRRRFEITALCVALFFGAYQTYKERLVQLKTKTKEYDVLKDKYDHLNADDEYLKEMIEASKQTPIPENTKAIIPPIAVHVSPEPPPT